MRLRKAQFKFLRRQAGISLLETLIAVAILGTVGATFLNGLTVASEASFTTDERTTAESLARTQMEWVKNITYVEESTTYPPAEIPAVESYVNYAATITAEPLHSPDEGIQKITVTITHNDNKIITLEGYKRE